MFFLQLSAAFFSRTAVICIALGLITVLSTTLVALYKSKQPNEVIKPGKTTQGPIFITSLNSHQISVPSITNLQFVTFVSFMVVGPPKLVILHMDMAIHTFDDIMNITENLNKKYIIGYGASSTVYKCTLKNSRPIAIKRLYRKVQDSREFETELETIGSIRHRNIVSLHGYALSPLGNLLFYDFMENGSLWDLLHG